MAKSYRVMNSVTSWKVEFECSFGRWTKVISEMTAMLHKITKQ